MSLAKFEKLTRKFFENEMTQLSGNEYKMEGDSFIISNSNISLSGHDDDIYMRISVSEMKGDIPYQAVISFVFDKLDRTLENYDLINQFNATVPFFTGNITDKGYFKIQWHFAVFEPEEFVLCLNRAIIRLVNMDGDDHILRKITARTH